MYAYDSMVEVMEVQPFCAPVDLTVASNDATTGDRLRMIGHRCLILVYKTAGTAGDDPTITIQQADAATGGTAKALNFSTIYRKESTTSIQSVGTWTKTTQAAASTYTNLTSAESYLLWAIEIKAEDLDSDGGFKFIQATIADAGGTTGQYGGILAIFGNLRFAGPTANHEDSRS